MTSVEMSRDNPPQQLTIECSVVRWWSGICGEAEFELSQNNGGVEK